MTADEKINDAAIKSLRSSIEELSSEKQASSTKQAAKPAYVSEVKQTPTVIRSKNIDPLTKQMQIKKISNRNKSKYKIDYSVSGEAFLTKPNNTTFMIRDIIKKITKIKPQLSTTGGTSDARFIRKIAPCLEFGLVGKTMHKVDEAVSLSDLKKLTLIYSNILQNYFK